MPSGRVGQNAAAAESSKTIVGGVVTGESTPAPSEPASPDVTVDEPSPAEASDASPTDVGAAPANVAVGPSAFSRPDPHAANNGTINNTNPQRLFMNFPVVTDWEGIRR